MSNIVDIVIDNDRSLFQYMSFEKCLSLIRNKALPLRNYLSYNDPFECLPEFVEYKAIQDLFTASTEDERRLSYLFVPTPTCHKIWTFK